MTLSKSMYIRKISEYLLSSPEESVVQIRGITAMQIQVPLFKS